MNCVKAQQLIRPYLDGVLSDRELEEFLDHVKDCHTCFGELELYFSIYRTLNNTDEKGDYNYTHKLRAKLRKSREYLHARQRNRVIKAGVILAAEACIVASFYALFRMPGGYIDRHRTEIIPVIETEASKETLLSWQEQQELDSRIDQTQGAQQGGTVETAQTGY